MSDDEGGQIGGMSQSELQEKQEKWKEEYDFTKEQINEIIETFAMYDVNDEGAIAVPYFRDAVRALGQSPTEKELDHLVEQCGLEDPENGVISLDDFVRVLGKRGIKSEMDMDDDLEEAINFFDKEKKGLCNTQQMLKTLAELGEPLSQSDINELEKMLDTDPEGNFSVIDLHQKLTMKSGF